jgi:peptide chain release factor 1
LKPTLLKKLETLSERLDELDALLAEPDVIADQQQFRSLAQERAEIDPVVACFGRYRAVERALAHAREMLDEQDPELRALAAEEVAQSKAELEPLEGELNQLLLPKDPADDANIFLEIRAGTGGDEAALFAADLLRMYLKYAEQRNWQTEIISTSASGIGGYKEVIAKIIGRGAYSRLKFESGAHRVQRVPETESQGRIHTSACTVAVLPEIDEVSEVDLNASDLRIDTFRASGAGGQHVNKTDSAIRVTHLPSGIVVECQDQRSRGRQVAEQAQTRRNLVGSGDRSERIRTYNFPQGRVTDHRINLTLYKLEEIMEGRLDVIIEPLANEHQADQMALMADA